MTDRDEERERHERLGVLFERLFADDSFADQLESDPEAALEGVGFRLSDEDREHLTAARVETAEGDRAVAAIPAVLVVVRVAISPSVRVGVASSVEVRVATATSAVASRRKQPLRDPNQADE